ncbi:MAG: GNAT family N-acetyltransferase [Parafilimonas sp.]
MKNIITRQVVKADNKPIAKLIRDVFDEYNAPYYGTVYSDPTTDDLYTLFQTKHSVLWVAQLENKILGCCGIYPTTGLPENCAELAKFYVLKEARGKGVGKQLMQCCFHSAKEMGYKKLYIESLPKFSQAVAMYEKYGFIRLDKPLGNSGHTSCNIWMLKELNFL